MGGAIDFAVTCFVMIIGDQRRLEALVCARDCRLLLCACDFE